MFNSPTARTLIDDQPPDGSRHRRARRRLGAVFTLTSALAGLAMIAAPLPAQAATPVTVDASWQEIITGGGVGGGTVKGPYDFTTTNLTKITVTDAFCHGDEFHVVDNGTLLGDTSHIAPEDHICPFKLFFPPNTRADEAILDPTFSHGTFYVAPGQHSLDVVNKVMWNDTATGTGAYFRLDSVTLTKNDCLNDGWRTYGNVFPDQRSCVSFATTSLLHPFQVPGFPLNGAKKLDGSPLTVIGGSDSAAGSTVFRARINGVPSTFEGNATVHWFNLTTFRGGEATMPYGMVGADAVAASAPLAVGAGRVVAAITTNGALAGQPRPYLSTPTTGYFVAS